MYVYIYISTCNYICHTLHMLEPCQNYVCIYVYIHTYILTNSFIYRIYIYIVICIDMHVYYLCHIPQLWTWLLPWWVESACSHRSNGRSSPADASPRCCCLHGWFYVFMVVGLFYIDLLVMYQFSNLQPFIDTLYTFAGMSSRWLLLG